jgi:phosphoglycolate phosphatase
VTARRYSVLCLDMAGTTVADANTVMNAFAAALASRLLTAREFNAGMQYAKATMGYSKIEVFRHILGAEEAAQAANTVFEETYGKSVAAGELSPIPGAVPLFAACRDAGIKVCLSTGFSPVTRDAIVAALGWGSLVEEFLSPADAGRGRPWPDMPLTALLRLGGGSVSELAVVGDTPSDIESGLRAGAGLVAGVLTGASSAAELSAVPAETSFFAPRQPGEPLILDSIADLAPHLGLG